MRILVCGSRTFADGQFVWDILRAYKAHGIDVVITGMAKGADTHAVNWANANHVTLHEYPADWTRHGRKAGLLRNEQMLKEGAPDIVLAFVDKPLEQSRGTADMVSRAMRSKVPASVLHQVWNLHKQCCIT